MMKTVAQLGLRKFMVPQGPDPKFTETLKSDSLLGNSVRGPVGLEGGTWQDLFSVGSCFVPLNPRPWASVYIVPYKGCLKTLVYNFRSTKTKHNTICQKPCAQAQRKLRASTAQGWRQVGARVRKRSWY